jgi:AAA15 family ATPase/GTPase
MKPLALSSLQVKNFKAIRNSGRLKLTPLTAFIGQNGSGKSSLVEALETVQTISLQGLDRAMLPWKGIAGLNLLTNYFEEPEKVLAEGW